MKKSLILLPLCLLFSFSSCKQGASNSQSSESEDVNLITLSETTISIPEERTYQLSAMIDDSLSQYLRFWSSDNEDIATVDDNGLVTAIKKGSTIILLQCGKYFARCAVTVTDYVPNDALSVYLSKDTYNLNVGDEYVISPVLKYGEETIVEGYTTDYDISDSSIASFDSEKLSINAINQGACDILLTFIYLSYSVSQLIYVNVY